MATSKLSKDGRKLILEVDEAEAIQLFAALSSVLEEPVRPLRNLESAGDDIAHYIWRLCQDN